MTRPASQGDQASLARAHYDYWTFTWQKSLDVGSGLTRFREAAPGRRDQLCQQLRFSAFLEQSRFGFTINRCSCTIGGYIHPAENALSGEGFYILQDWQVGTLLIYSSGLPIPAPAATTSTVEPVVSGRTLWTAYQACALFGSQPQLSLLPITQRTAVLNPAAWADPPAGQFGTAAMFYDDGLSLTSGIGRKASIYKRTWHIKKG